MSRLQLSLYAGLLQNAVRCIAGGYRGRHRKRFIGQRAVPNFMAPFTLSNKFAVVFAQQVAERRVEPASHKSHRDKVLVVALVEIEVKPDLLYRNREPILHGHLGGNLPYTGANSVKSCVLSDDAEVITDSSEHPRFRIKSDRHTERCWELDYVCHQVDGTHNFYVAHPRKSVYAPFTFGDQP